MHLISSELLEPDITFTIAIIKFLKEVFTAPFKKNPQPYKLSVK